MKEVAVLNGVHVYELGSGSENSNELLTNGSFEEGDATTLPGWQLVGKSEVDRTGKHSVGGRAACAVTAKDVLLSEPVPVEEDQCYRLAVRENGGASKVEKFLLQLNWKDEGKNDLHVPTVVTIETRSAQRWRQSRSDRSGTERK